MSNGFEAERKAAGPRLASAEDDDDDDDDDDVDVDVDVDAKSLLVPAARPLAFAPVRALAAVEKVDSGVLYPTVRGGNGGSVNDDRSEE